MNVKDIMSMSVQTCVPQDSLEAAARLLWEHDCGCLPVVDSDKRPKAMITDRDICMAAYTRGQPLAGLRVADSMSTSIATCRQEDDLGAVARKMAKQQVRRLPVVDADGKLVGLVSLNDLAGASGENATARIADPAAAEALRVLTAVCRRRAKVPVVAERTMSIPSPSPKPQASQVGSGI